MESSARGRARIPLGETRAEFDRQWERPGVGRERAFARASRTSRRTLYAFMIPPNTLWTAYLRVFVSQSGSREDAGSSLRYPRLGCARAGRQGASINDKILFVYSSGISKPHAYLRFNCPTRRLSSTDILH